ncbi:MAG: SGNH/GDSL hydrolase family protein [Nanoarchaeota archaeon]|nr:SGNH/GDSL hydrolase family protein [Nanoarchaeota archaeon]
MKQSYFILPCIALVVSTVLYLVFINSFDNFGPHGTRFNNILEKYNDLPAGSILFIGDSQIQEGIDCTLIEKESIETCFNFGLAGLVPMQMALQKDLVIATKPKFVVIGVSAAFFDESINKNEDLFLLLNDHGVAADSFLQERLTDQEKKLLSMNYFEKALYKRKFILPLYVGIFDSLISPSEQHPNVVTNFKNPRFFIHQQQREELTAKLQDPAVRHIFEIEKSARRQRDAFHYFVRELKQAGIEVVVLNMPYHPLVLEQLSPASQQAFNNYLLELSQALNFELIDLQHQFSAADFNDLTHLNAAGSEKLSFSFVKGDDRVIQ